MRPLNWPMIAACAASRPNTRPAMAMTISSSGAIEKIVKYAIDAARLKASSAMKPETVSLIRFQLLANIDVRPLAIPTLTGNGSGRTFDPDFCHIRSDVELARL